MKLLTTTFAASLLAAPLAVAALPLAIEQLDLRKMLERADTAVLGKIVHRATFTVEVPDLGPMEFTSIQVQGEDIVQGRTVTHEVTYIGSEARPNSEMPAEADTRAGNSVLVFSKASKAFGMKHDLHWMIAAHGGIFRVEAGPKGDVVLGRGEGYAIESSLLSSDLRARVTKTLAEIRQRK